MSKTVSIETTKKIGFMTGLSMLIGSVIGIGIFLKNAGIFSTNQFNPTGIILTWVIGSIIALATAFSFSEIGSSVRSRAGLGAWAEKLLGRKAGYFIKVLFPLFYMGIMMVVLSIFAAESLFVIFDTDTSQPFGIVLLVGFLLMFYFLIFNLVSLKLSGIFSSLTTILKFVPLLMIIIAGIVIASMNGNGGLIGTAPGSPVPGAGENAPVVGEFNFGFVIASLPSVLFAFDSFANVGNLALDIKNPKKNVPLVIVVGIILSAVFYILVTISQLFRSNGNGIDFFNDPLFAEASIALTYTIRFFILISVIGVVNSFSASSLRAFQSLISENLFFASDSVRKISSKTPFIKKYELANGFILEIIVICIWWTIIMLPSVIVNADKGGTDAFVDGISNFPTMFFFLVYGALIMGALWNRKTNKVKVQKQKFFLVIGPIAIIGILIIFSYLFFFWFLINPIMLIDDHTANYGWGLFYTNGFVTTPWYSLILFFLSLLTFIFLPIINFKLKKRSDKKKGIITTFENSYNPLIDEEDNEEENIQYNVEKNEYI